jgi:zinc transport system permease protein
MAYLFGDLLSVQPMDLLWIYGGGAWCCSPCGGSGIPCSP